MGRVKVMLISRVKDSDKTIGRKIEEEATVSYVGASRGAQSTQHSAVRQSVISASLACALSYA